MRPGVLGSSVAHFVLAKGRLDLPAVAPNVSGADEKESLFHSPASFLCSCGVWSPSRLSLWLHCACGNSCSDLEPDDVKLLIFRDLKKENLGFWLIKALSIRHGRCFLMINSDHPLYFLWFRFSSAEITNIFLVWHLAMQKVMCLRDTSLSCTAETKQHFI